MTRLLALMVVAVPLAAAPQGFTLRTPSIADGMSTMDRLLAACPDRSRVTVHSEMP